MKPKPLILASLLLAAFVINLDTTIVNVALPTLVRELHGSNTQLQWVVDAYNLFFAAAVLAAGSLSDRVGRVSPGRWPHRRSRPAHRRAGRHGDRLSDGVPVDAVADLQRVHPAERA